jgi:CRISPR-associated endonuclease/helicase Cas3
MPYLARSADTERGAPPQTYLEHVLHVLVRSRCCLRKVLHYARNWDSAAMLRILELAAEYHDLGKLDDENQQVLRGEVEAKRLPVSHADAGVAVYADLSENVCSFYSALLIYAHHAGLPDISRLADQGLRNVQVEQHINDELTELLNRHDSCVRSVIMSKPPVETTAVLKAADVRVLFSCLTHADHGDAARASRSAPEHRRLPKLRAAERLEALRRYVEKLSAAGDASERNVMRTTFFDACCEGGCDHSIAICDAPVGTGKTTAVMSYLLNVAKKQRLRRIFVILPFTNIIEQSVKTYRKALVLEGERDTDVVAEIHHRADFEDAASRKLTALWDAPIVVTTAVAFFETLASASPTALRRLQNLPGSAVFLDEAHAMLPVKLLPLAWQWIQHAGAFWSCHWVLASGSLCHFWSLEEFQTEGCRHRLPNLLPPEAQMHLETFEVARVQHRYKPETMTLSDLAYWLYRLEGPIIVVLNTVHTAAALAANAAVCIFGEDNVFHLSTALIPEDRERTLNLVKARLVKDKVEGRSSARWCLFATSCVEAGVDLSFRTGVRECASLLSVLQLAGRVNRNSEYLDADVWTVTLNANDRGVTRNPSLTCSSRILRNYFNAGMEISPALCTDAIKKEIRENGDFSSRLLEKENRCSFATVEKEFKVIDDDSQLTVINRDLVRRIKAFDDVSWRDIQNSSVRIRKTIRDKLDIEESVRYPGILLWPDGVRYSSFLGYMQAVLDLQDFDSNGGAVV